ncbi:modification methylase CeqI [Shouchella rhizosphaerae]|uniref:response regulator aspartate phosphatase n=1 Tax=Shouchella rhizosphaerae TaxID=866786 RepID=UPI00203AEE2C|nr:modification methylase CeqI [Shouchella rhizosphaerae]MCM3381740.1 modification methylase CeqI [Shouchella rhizosphaerae]
MASSISPEKLGAKIVEWYSCIVSREVEQAEEYKQEIGQLVNQLERSDEKVLSYYSLVLFRHQLLTEDVQQKRVEPTYLQAINAETTVYDGLLAFLYYFMSGQYEFYEGRYQSALRLYKIAEQKIDHVHDQSEKAEFYFRLGESYFRIDQYTFAVSYLEQAIDLFEEQQFYLERILNCRLLLAAIKTELNLFDEAEKEYQSALADATPYPTTHALLLRALGLNRVRQRKLHEAEMYFAEALTIGDHSKSVEGLKTKANLANVRLRQNANNAEAIRLLQEAKAGATAIHLEECMVRCAITEALYINEGRDERLTSELQRLLEREFYTEYSELAEEIAEYYKQQSLLEKAFYYMKEALHYRTNMKMIGVEQQ